VPEDSDSDKKGEIVSTKAASIADSFDATEEANELDPIALSKAYRFASWSSIALFVILILLVPLPLFFSQHVYTVPGFTGWVAVGITWTFCSAFAVVLYPLWESRSAMVQIAKGVSKVRFPQLFDFSPCEEVLMWVGILCRTCSREEAEDTSHRLRRPRQRPR
jgi:hypothetical protein